MADQFGKACWKHDYVKDRRVLALAILMGIVFQVIAALIIGVLVADLGYPIHSTARARSAA